MYRNIKKLKNNLFIISIWLKMYIIKDTKKIITKIWMIIEIRWKWNCDICLKIMMIKIKNTLDITIKQMY